ncbi:prolyl oligopeptidase family serine peptidase [Spongiactinospora sp. TRM90649]|uniref:alpha/beta hydrolase family protein n=1 Tax=Spongiactinospora sp. TRM90649 TaxID=3031114 RepID=UPI0023F9F1E2|nr:prolyl oligopeptidase family serine peptidase [Spongiactinospora sp. TRM90649]MDF5752344.1 prolyl oligopeptidase family serine peptidase [Spongiactinospora sp. TRM90649]
MQAGRGTLSVAAGLVLVVLATVGYALPPSFDPPPLRADAAFTSLPPQPASERTPVAAKGPITTEEVTVPLQGTSSRAMIWAPMTPGPHPAVVFVHGSGSADRREFATQAEWLAKAGIIAMGYDKRSVGYSFSTRDFGLLADDILRMVHHLRNRPDVDRTRIGLWGVSEGTWATPIAAARSSDVGFLVMVSAPNVSPLRQVAWALNEQLLRLYAPVGVRDLLSRAMGVVGLPFLRHDPLPWLSEVRQPVLALYGTMDPSIPFVESTEALTEGLAQAGNDRYTIRFLGGADHAMRIHAGPFAPGYQETLANWIDRLPESGKPTVRMAGANPVQRYQASDVPAAPWYAGGTVLGLALCLAVVGYVAGPVAGIVVRLRGRDHRAHANAVVWPPIRRRLRRMAATGLGLLVSVLGFITLLVLFSINQAGAWPAVLSGWLVVRGLAVLMLLQEVTAVAAVVSGLREGWQPSRGQHVAIAGVVGGTGVLLAVAAYYGLFSFPW